MRQTLIRPSLVILGAVLLGLAFHSSWFSIAAFGALVPLVVSSIRSTNLSETFGLGFLFGMCFLFIALVWMVDPTTLSLFASGSRFAVFALLALVSLITVFGGAALFGVWTLTLRYLYQLGDLLGKAGLVLGGAFLFVAMELLRMIGFSVVFAKSEWIPDPFFSFAFLGYLGGDFPGLLQFARVGEVFGLSFLFCLINLSIALVILNVKGKYRHVAALLAAGLCILSLEIGLQNLIPRASSAMLHVIAIGIAPLERGGTYATGQLEAALQGANTGTLVILPEASTIGSSSVGEGAPAILVSERRLEEEGMRYEAFLVSTESDSGVRSGKRILVPFGEYVPLIARPLFSAFTPEILAQLDARRVIPSEETTLLPTSFGKIGVLFCNELWSPFFAREEASRGARMLAVPASHGWFGDSASLDRATLLALKVRAVASNVPIIQATKRGMSAAVDSQGRVVGTAPLGKVLEVYMPL